MNKKELLACMEEINMHPGKILGQNFLMDNNLLDLIVRESGIGPDTVVLEVGPGFGALTRKMLAAGGNVYAVEFDHRICEFLRRNPGEGEYFHLTEGDACRVYFDRILPAGKPYRAIANLPYAISSIFIARLLELEQLPEVMLFMLQKEMAQRLAADTRTKNYGALSVRVQQCFSVEIIREVPPEVFCPPPAVNSALAFFRRKDVVPPVALRKKLSAVVKTAFAQRRKQMQKVLCGNFPPETVKNAFTTLGLPPEIRPEVVPVETFVQLAELLLEDKK